MTPFNIGDAPIEDEYRVVMNKLAKGLDTILNGQERPKKTGFVLMVFPFGEALGRCNYISNADRKDIIIMLKEQLARFQGMPTGEGHG